jgi:hypothetical protein
MRETGKWIFVMVLALNGMPMLIRIRVCFLKVRLKELESIFGLMEKYIMENGLMD